MDLIVKTCGPPTSEAFLGSLSEEIRNELKIYTGRQRKFKVLLKQDLPGEDSLIDLLDRMLQVDPDMRINAEQVLSHRFFSDFPLACQPYEIPLDVDDTHEYLTKK